MIDKEVTCPITTGESFTALNNLNISAKVVEQLLSKLIVNKGSGPDQLPNYYLKETAKQLDCSNISNSVLTVTEDRPSVLPSDWLTMLPANVSPIFKKWTVIQP